jgi:hypothetical protein
VHKEFLDSVPEMAAFIIDSVNHSADFIYAVGDW